MLNVDNVLYPSHGRFGTLNKYKYKYASSGQGADKPNAKV
jgi:hypothetical protein